MLSSFSSYSKITYQKHFKFCMRNHYRSHIPAIHYYSSWFSHLILLCTQMSSYNSMSWCFCHPRIYLRRSNFFFYISAIHVHMKGSVCIRNKSQLNILNSIFFQCKFFIVLQSVLQTPQCHCSVHCSCIYIDISQCCSNSFGRGSFSRSCSAVNSNGYMFHDISEIQN